MHLVLQAGYKQSLTLSLPRYMEDFKQLFQPCHYYWANIFCVDIHLTEVGIPIIYTAWYFMFEWYCFPVFQLIGISVFIAVG